MARGWESKSVESQMEDRQRRDTTAPLAPEERERRKRLESLLLSRKAITVDLEKARHENHRIMLRRALEHLDAEIGKLEGTAE